jgi:hypothetical protein
MGSVGVPAPVPARIWSWLKLQFARDPIPDIGATPDWRPPRRARVWALILALAGFALGLVPLLDVLGFDLSFALGLLTAPAAVDVGHAVGRTWRQNRIWAASGRVWSVALRAALFALGLLVLPLLISLAGALRVRNCNLGAGFAFFFLLPVGTALFAAPLGALAGLLFPRHGRLIAFLLPIGSLAWALLRLYTDPPAFALDPFGGYFPGPIYDEALTPPMRLVTFRLVNLVWVATALLVAQVVQRVRISRGAGADPRGLVGPALIALAFGAASLVLFGQRGPLGFAADKPYLLSILRRTTTSPHFVVASDPTGDGSPEDRALVLRDLEFRYSQLTRILGAEPAGPVTVYLFPSAEAKKALVGAGGTLYAKPWKREIFVQSDRFPARHLRHELAHVFAGAFGDPIFGISLAWRWPLPRLSSGMVEGIAEAADFGDPDGQSTVHQDARAMILAGLAPPLSKIVGAGFSTVAGARAYTIAGSFTHFLLASFGADKLRAIYRSGGDFVTVYGQDLPALESQWRHFLEQQPVDDREKARAKERYRRPAIFQKVCARDIAARIENARGHLYSLPDEAVAIFTSVCQDDPDEPGHRLNLADAQVAAGQPAPALATAAAMAADTTLTDPLRARAANLSANIHFHAGRIDDAKAALTLARDLATDEGEQRTAFARTRALADPTARATLGRILFGDSPTRGVDPGLVIYLADRFARAFPDEALGPYMVGRQLSFRDPKLALPVLAEACPLGDAPELSQPLPPVFRAECHRMVGEAAFRAGQLDTSAAAWERLREKGAALGDRLRAGDFLERIAWEKKRVGGQ